MTKVATSAFRLRGWLMCVFTAARRIAGMTSRPEVKEVKAQRRVDDLLQAPKFKEDESVRLESARALGELRDAEAIGPLIEAMKDESEKVRLEVAKSLAKIGKPAGEALMRLVREGGSEIPETLDASIMPPSRIDQPIPPASGKDWNVTTTPLAT